MKIERVKKTLELAHGELDVLITPRAKKIRFSDKSTGRPSGFIYELDIQIVDGFDEITLTVNAVMYEFMKWDVRNNSWDVRDKGDSKDWEDAFELAEELMAHGFMDAIEGIF